MIAVIDYDAGNIRNVEKALQFIGCETCVTRDPAVLRQASAAVLPGVGAFGDAMASLTRSGLIGPICDFVASGRPFLGICLGLQLLFAESEEIPWGQRAEPITGKSGTLSFGYGTENSAYRVEFPAFSKEQPIICGSAGRRVCLFCTFLLFTV